MGCLLGLALNAGAAWAADGLNVPAADTWPVWQARVNLTVSERPADGVRLVRQAALLGDFYLQRHGVDATSRWRGGFRATSGLVVGALGLSADAGAWSTSLLSVVTDSAGPEPDAWPYIGFGYSGLAPRGGWGFSADFGLTLRQPAAAPELGRALLGLRGWESAIRSIDPVPVLQLGVRYTF